MICGWFYNLQFWKAYFFNSKSSCSLIYFNFSSLCSSSNFFYSCYFLKSSCLFSSIFFSISFLIFSLLWFSSSLIFNNLSLSFKIYSIISLISFSCFLMMVDGFLPLLTTSFKWPSAPDSCSLKRTSQLSWFLPP